MSNDANMMGSREENADRRAAEKQKRQQVSPLTHEEQEAKKKAKKARQNAKTTKYQTTNKFGDTKSGQKPTVKPLPGSIVPNKNPKVSKPWSSQWDGFTFPEGPSK